MAPLALLALIAQSAPVPSPPWCRPGVTVPCIVGVLPPPPPPPPPPPHDERARAAVQRMVECVHGTNDAPKVRLRQAAEQALREAGPPAGAGWSKARDAVLAYVRDRREQAVCLRALRLLIDFGRLDPDDLASVRFSYDASARAWQRDGAYATAALVRLVDPAEGELEARAAATNYIEPLRTRSDVPRTPRTPGP